MPKKITIGIVREEAERRGYTLVSKEYIRSSCKLNFICPNGHEYLSTWDNFNRGNKCINGICNPQRKRIGDVRKEFKGCGYTVLEDEYINSNTPMKVECPNGHKVTMTRGNFVSHNKRCIVCYNEENTTSFGYVKSFFDSIRYTLLSKKYVNNYSHLDYMCDRGHVSKAVWGNFKMGDRCKFCQVEDRIIDVKVVNRELKKYGYELIESTYKMAKKSFEVICPEGHRTSMYLYNFRRGNRCGTCDSHNKMSKPEKEVADFVKSIYSGEVLENTRKVIKPFELDIYIPSKKLAIEYNGLYWHSEERGKDKFYHYNKVKLCAEKGIRLITIFEDEFLADKEKVFAKLKSIIVRPNKPIYYMESTKIISDLRWDTLKSDKYYIKKGFILEKDFGPSVYNTIRIKKQKDVIYSNIWDCGKLVYTKK